MELQSSAASSLSLCCQVPEEGYLRVSPRQRDMPISMGQIGGSPSQTSSSGAVSEMRLCSLMRLAAAGASSGTVGLLTAASSGPSTSGSTSSR